MERKYKVTLLWVREERSPKEDDDLDVELPGFNVGIRGHSKALTSKRRKLNEKYSPRLGLTLRRYSTLDTRFQVDFENCILINLKEF